MSARFIASVGCVVEVGRRQVRVGRRMKTVIDYKPNPHLYELAPGVYIGHPAAILSEQVKRLKGVL